MVESPVCEAKEGAIYGAPRLPDHHGLALEANAEAIVDRAFDRTREREQLRRGAAVVDQGQRVVAGDSHATAPVPLRESRALDEPRRRDLYSAIRGKRGDGARRRAKAVPQRLERSGREHRVD